MKHWIVALLLIAPHVLMSLACATAAKSSIQQGSSCKNGGGEERRRCFVEALADCRVVRVEVVDSGGESETRKRFGVVPGRDGNCEASIEYLDSGGYPLRTLRCVALWVDFEDFWLAPSPGNCWEIASDR